MTGNWLNSESTIQRAPRTTGALGRSVVLSWVHQMKYLRSPLAQKRRQPVGRRLPGPRGLRGTDCRKTRVARCGYILAALIRASYPQVHPSIEIKVRRKGLTRSAENLIRRDRDWKATLSQVRNKALYKYGRTLALDGTTGWDQNSPKSGGGFIGGPLTCSRRKGRVLRRSGSEGEIRYCLGQKGPRVVLSWDRKKEGWEL